MASILMPRMRAPRSRGCAALWVRETRSRLAPGVGVRGRSACRSGASVRRCAHSRGLRASVRCACRRLGAASARFWPPLRSSWSLSQRARAASSTSGVVVGASRFGAAGVACFWWLAEAPCRWLSRHPVPRVRAVGQRRSERLPRPLRARGGVTSWTPGDSFSIDAGGKRCTGLGSVDQPVPVRRCVELLGLRVGLLLERAPVPSLRVGLGDPCGACGAHAVRPRCFGRSRRVVARGVLLGGFLLQASKRQRGKKLCNCRLLGPAAPDHGVPVHGAAAPGARGSVCCVPALLGLLAPDLDAPAGHSTRGAFPLLFLPLWRRHRGMLLVVARGASPVVGPAPYA